MQPKTYDIIIVGGGMVGATLACALAQQTHLSIAVLETQAQFPAWTNEQYHHRVSAIALASKRIFQALKVWDSISAKRVSPFTKIEVWDGVKPAKIQFDSREIAEPLLGYIIENNVIQLALEEKIKNFPQIDWIAPVTLTAVEESPKHITLMADNGQCYQASLLVAADGGNSWLRNQMQITVKKHDYEQMAIVATVQTELPHDQVARQAFLKTGPLAFLPLQETKLSSIVWSLPKDEAARLLACDAEIFKYELAQAFALQLGAITHLEKRYSFPLIKQEARQYIKSRVVLVGDAAHTVHPLAGQGVNLGLLDAASLAEVIVNAVQKRRDFASHANLRVYERWRRADNANMLSGVDLIKKLFASENTPLQHIRSIGLTATNKSSWLKNLFVRHAVGNRSGLPQLAR